MKSSRIILGFLFLAILMAAVPGKALEGKVLVWRYNAHSADLPFPRSKRAEAYGRPTSAGQTAVRIVPGGWPVASGKTLRVAV